MTNNKDDSLRGSKKIHHLQPASITCYDSRGQIGVPSIETVEVTKAYRVGHVDYPALKGVSLRIERGELTSIIGPSGSGKSTLLNIIGALDRPTSGRVKIDGVDIRKLSDDQLAKIRNRKIGFIY